MAKEEKKEVVVSIAPEIGDPELYRYFLVTSEESGLRIDLAEKTETEKEIVVKVKESFEISADMMLKFALDILNELISYEEKYQNGKGLPRPK